MSKLPAPLLLDGSSLPPLIYGTTINESPHCQPSLVDAIRHGYRGIDTASTRKFHNEALDGDRIRAVMAQGPINREALLIQTKYTSPSDHPDDETTWPYSIEDSPSLRVLRSVGGSTDDLKVDVIDVYLPHRILDSLADTVAAWKSLEKIVGRSSNPLSRDLQRRRLGSPERLGRRECQAVVRPEQVHPWRLEV